MKQSAPESSTQGVYTSSLTKFQDISKRYPGYILKNFQKIFTRQAIQYQNAGEVCHVDKWACDDELWPTLIILPSTMLIKNFPTALTKFQAISSISTSNFKFQEISRSCSHPATARFGATKTIKSWVRWWFSPPEGRMTVTADSLDAIMSLRVTLCYTTQTQLTL